MYETKVLFLIPTELFELLIVKAVFPVSVKAQRQLWNVQDKDIIDTLKIVPNFIGVSNLISMKMTTLFSNMDVQMAWFSMTAGKSVFGQLKPHLAMVVLKLDPYPKIPMFALKKAILWTLKIVDGFSPV